MITIPPALVRAVPQAALVVALAVPLAAQAPRITPAGDPSVKDDTLYALAVRPEDHADESYVYLLDDGVVTIEADGRATSTYRQVIQILNRDAAENWGELSFSYAPGRERLTVNWVRVLGLDGHLISDRPVHEQESRASVAEAAPVYTDATVRRLSLGGVAPGTIVDYSVTTTLDSPLVRGDFHAGWRVTTGRLTRRSRYIVDAPDSVALNVEERNFHGPRPVTVSGGRRTWVWAAADVPRLQGEPFAAEPNTVEVFVDVALPRRWDDVARDYEALARDRYRVDTTLAARLAELVRGATTLEDSLRAVHRWVAQDFRYVSLSLGIGGYQPRPPAAVLETRYGDCKDKATLFIALARHMGLRAWPVLLSQAAAADSLQPTVAQFDHMIAAVELPGRPGYLYLDLTADLTPFGELPAGEQGGFALVVKDGHGERVVLPQAPVTDNRTEIRVVGTLTPDGRFNGRYTRSGSGSRQYALRSAFAEPLVGENRSRFLREVASSVFEEASGDSLQAFDGRDLRAPARISLVVRGGRAVRSTGGLDLLTLPLDNIPAQDLASDLASRGARRFPIDKAAVTGPFVYDAELDLTLPDGWRARLPQNVSVTGAFGSYRAEYAQDGQRLRVHRELVGARGVEPPDRIGDLIQWLRDVSRDDVRFLVLEHGAP